MKFPTKRIFGIFPILRINGMVPFCNLFIERPSYKYLGLHGCAYSHSHLSGCGRPASGHTGLYTTLKDFNFCISFAAACSQQS